MLLMAMTVAGDDGQVGSSLKTNDWRVIGADCGIAETSWSNYFVAMVRSGSGRKIACR